MGTPYAEVIGNPVAHSKSPLIHKFWLEKLGLEGDYRATIVSPESLASFLDERLEDEAWTGCSVTIPHKIIAARLMGSLDPCAAAIGAVNCIVPQDGPKRHLLGYNTDLEGFIEPLWPWLRRNDQLRVASVVGTGGAAAAVSRALRDAGFIVVTYARTYEKAADFRRRMELDDDPDFALEIGSLSQPVPSEVRSDPDVLDLFVNASPLGMDGFPPLRVDMAAWPASTLVYDLVYSPLETALLRQARGRGMPTIDGLSMLIGQAALAFGLFFGVSPPRDYDAELRGLLTR